MISPSCIIIYVCVRVIWVIQFEEKSNRTEEMNYKGMNVLEQN